MMYEKETKFRPLVCMDADGIDHAAMFMALDEDSVKAHHRLYLKETTPYAYRLCSSEYMSAADCRTLRIRCPRCNVVMRPITAQRSGTYHALYVCDRCS